jgi:hypothetical protein
MYGYVMKFFNFGHQFIILCLLKDKRSKEPGDCVIMRSQSLLIDDLIAR